MSDIYLIMLEFIHDDHLDQPDLTNWSYIAKLFESDGPEMFDWIPEEYEHEPNK